MRLILTLCVYTRYAKTKQKSNTLYRYSKLTWSRAWQDEISVPICQCFARTADFLNWSVHMYIALSWNHKYTADIYQCRKVIHQIQLTKQADDKVERKKFSGQFSHLRGSIALLCYFNHFCLHSHQLT